MARCLKSSLYIHQLLTIIIHLSPFINHLKITLKVMLKQKSNHFIVQSLSQHPLKASPGKSNARMYNSFISQEKERKSNHKKQRKDIIENLFLLFVAIAREHVDTKSTQGTLAHDHVSTQSTQEHEHVSTQGALAREHVSTKSTLARGHVRHAVQQTPITTTYSTLLQ